MVGVAGRCDGAGRALGEGGWEGVAHQRRTEVVGWERRRMVVLWWADIEEKVEGVVVGAVAGRRRRVGWGKFSLQFVYGSFSVPKC